jgi:hypothetical protein
MSCPCSICGKGGHSASRCKELAPPPPDGFYKPAPGQHQHDEDCDDAIPDRQKRYEDEDETINIIYLKINYQKLFSKKYKEEQSHLKRLSLL